MLLRIKYVFEGNLVNEEDIILVVKLYNELCENNIEAELFEHNRKTNIEFLNNLVESYYNINVEISERIDQMS